MGISWDPLEVREALCPLYGTYTLKTHEIERIARNSYTAPTRELVGSQLVRAAGDHRSTCNQNKNPRDTRGTRAPSYQRRRFKWVAVISNAFSIKKVFVKAPFGAAKGGVRHHCVLRPCGVAGAHELRHATVWFLTLLRNDRQACDPHWIRTENGS